jgi:hypothetical protein
VAEGLCPDQRFQNQEELLGKHGVASLATAPLIGSVHVVFEFNHLKESAKGRRHGTIARIPTLGCDSVNVDFRCEIWLSVWFWCSR